MVEIILTKSAVFTEAPLSQRSFTLEVQPAMTVEIKKQHTYNYVAPFNMKWYILIHLTQAAVSGPRAQRGL